MNNLVIRVDAGLEIGIGHVMRCLALAQSWQDSGGRIYFVFANKNPELEGRILDAGMNIILLDGDPASIENCNNLIKIARDVDANWLVVDGYHFGAEYQKTIKEAGMRLLVIDDFGHSDHYYADIVLNQNIYATSSFYECLEPYTRLLLGTKYALLRKEFLKFSGWKRENKEKANNVLVTLGGGDPQNVTLNVIESLKKIQDARLQAKIIVGGANPHYSELKNAVQNFPHYMIIKNGTNMPELMAWADIAITAGGSTCWELAYMQLPGITINQANNQIRTAEVLNQYGTVINLGWFEKLPYERILQTLEQLMRSQHDRKKMAEKGRFLIDGHGSQRVLQCMVGDLNGA
jgi:UDP-2,4-diacetamido-2,4,6-trideoxy-beta-L-altropyranose hydrolase